MKNVHCLILAVHSDLEFLNAKFVKMPILSPFVVTCIIQGHIKICEK